MDVVCYIKEIEKYLDTFKNLVERERKEIYESQRNFSALLLAFSQKAPSNSVINSLFKDEEPDGFVFSKYEEKRKQLAEQRRAEYNAFLEKKEKEHLSKHRYKDEKSSVAPKSILDSVDYERVLAKRKEEEAKFRNMNLADVLNSSKPVILGENIKKYNVQSMNAENFLNTQSISDSNLPLINLPGSVVNLEEQSSKYPLVEEKIDLDFLKKDDAHLEERIAKHLEEQRRQMLLEFENELRRNNKIREEIESLRANSTKSSPQRLNTKTDDFPKIRRTGGGGEPVRDSLGNLLAMRGSRNENSSDYKSIISFPSMQEQPMKDRMALYREELQKQIEDKKRLEAIERDKAQELEEKIAQRIEEQRLQMQREYEKELQKNNKIKQELQFQRQQERIRKLEEFQRKDAEARRKKLPESKPPESENTLMSETITERSNSPPIPAVRTKVLLEKAVSPVTTKQALTEVKPENVFSSLAEIRRKIMQDQQKPKKDLNSYQVMNRRTVQDISDEEDDDDILRTSY